MSDVPGRLTAIELFSGAGGMALGFEQAGFDVLAAVDLDPVHLAAHERNFPLCEPLCADVSELGGDVIMEAARRAWSKRSDHAALPGPVDCVFGGPSCQGFSVIGPRDAADPRNGLIVHFARVVAELRPRWFVMENVPGLVAPRYADALNALCGTLRMAGYVVSEPWRLNASSYGVPQERKRVFIVGARQGEKLPVEPEGLNGAPTVEDALSGLPALARFRTLYDRDALEFNDDQIAAMLDGQSEYVRDINGAMDDSADLADRRLWDPRRVTCVGLTRHADSVKRRFRRLRPGDRDDVGRLPKLNASAQAPTLRAGTGRDHGSFTSARPVHSSSPRVITVREAARLQGFPDWFEFHATKWHGFRQVGNAVPPPLARAVAESVVSSAGAAPRRRQGLVLELGDQELLRLSMEAAADRYGLDRSKLPANVRARAFAKERAA